jgi:alpha-ketoglutarate-dependent taurine dioxygenase
MTGLDGFFTELPTDPHVSARERVLCRTEWYAAPVAGEPRPETFETLLRGRGDLTDQLVRHGFAHVRLDRALSNAELIALAAQLGTPQPQFDDRLAGYIEDGVVLDLRLDNPETDDHEWKLLFAENYVMAHSELAGRPPPLQPRFQLFQCVEPPVRDAGGQTLLIDMAALCERLGIDHVAVLARTRNASFTNSPPFIWARDNRPVISFKDTAAAGFPWQTVAEVDEAAVVNESIRQLLLGTYDPDHVRGVHWESGVLAVFDNHRWLHARSRGRIPVGRPPRHLKEIRVGGAVPG